MKSVKEKGEVMTAEDWKPSTALEHRFDELFFALNGHRPFRRQSRLFEHFATSEWPCQVDLPTGLGKRRSSLSGGASLSTRRARKPR